MFKDLACLRTCQAPDQCLRASRHRHYFDSCQGSKLRKLQPVVSYRLGGESMWGLVIMSWYGGTNGWHTTSQNRINGDGWQILVICRDPITNNGRGYKLEEKSFSCKLDNIFHVKITEIKSTNHENTALRLSLSITHKKIILNLLPNYKFWNCKF